MLNHSPENPSQEDPPSPHTLQLTAIEARVLATLLEKARTVPDSYPLTLNSLLAGCNQKTSRDPTMDLTDSEVQTALESLRALRLVGEVSGSRALRYQHNFQRGVGVNEQCSVLLGLLMLRGPQTVAELRINAERWYGFADNSSVQGFLEDLQVRAAEKGGPLVTLLAKAPGAREARWAHLLCGPVDASSFATSQHAGLSSHSTAERLLALETEVARLRATVTRLCQELGMADDEADGVTEDTPAQ